VTSNSNDAVEDNQVVTQKQIAVATEVVEQRIYFVRGQKVMLDSDLAELYGVATKRLNEAVTAIGIVSRAISGSLSRQKKRNL
jgi:hypothetical protein